MSASSETIVILASRYDWYGSLNPVSVQDAIKEVRDMIRKGYNINIVTTQNNNILHRIVQNLKYPRPLFVKQLVELGASITHKNDKGQTPLQSYLYDANGQLRGNDLFDPDIFEYLGGTQFIVDLADPNSAFDDAKAIQFLDYIVIYGYQLNYIDPDDDTQDNILHKIVKTINNPRPIVLRKLVALKTSLAHENRQHQTPLQVYLDRVHDEYDPQIFQILGGVPQSSTNRFLKSKFKFVMDDYRDINSNLENRQLLNHFFADLKLSQDYGNIELCTILEDIFEQIRITSSRTFNQASSALHRTLINDNDVNSTDINDAFNAYTTPKIYRYINQYFRTGKTVNDINAMYIRQGHADHILKGFTNDTLSKYIGSIQHYYKSYTGRLKVNTNDVYLMRGSNIDFLGLQLNKSILVQGYTSTTTNSIVAGSFLKGHCCLMVLHVKPGVSYAPLRSFSDAQYEDEILLENNVFFTLRGSIDCRKNLGYIVALIDVTNTVTDFDINVTDSYHYQPQSGLCYKISQTLYDHFNESVQTDLEHLHGSIIREICQSLDLSMVGNKYDLIMSIKQTFNTSPIHENCIPERFETLFCALMGSKEGCLKYAYKHESIIATTSVVSTAPTLSTMSSEPRTKRRNL